MEQARQFRWRAEVTGVHPKATDAEGVISAGAAENGTLPMVVSEVRVTDDILDAIGEAGVRAACSQLWPVDCLVCGQPLGADPPGLWVQPMMAEHTVALCHYEHVPPFGKFPQTVAGVSWRASALSIGSLDDGYTPLLLLNPSAEQLSMTPANGRWKVRPDLRFPGSGLPMFTSRFSDLNIGAPVIDATFQFKFGSVGLKLSADTYYAPTNDRFLTGLREHSGCHLLVTHAIWADSGIQMPDLVAAVDGGWAAVGWIGF
jgi:hypothetical protein